MRGGKGKDCHPPLPLDDLAESGAGEEVRDSMVDGENTVGDGMEGQKSQIFETDMQRISVLSGHTRLKMALTFTLLLLGEVAVFFVSEESDADKEESGSNALVMALFCTAQICLALCLARSSGLVLTALTNLDEVSLLLTKPLLEKSKGFPYENALCLFSPDIQQPQNLSQKDNREKNIIEKTWKGRKVVERESNMIQRSNFGNYMDRILKKCIFLELHTKKLLSSNNTSPIPVVASGAVVYIRYRTRMDSFNNLLVDPVPRFANIVTICREIERYGGAVDMTSLHAVLAHWTDRVLDTTFPRENASSLIKSEREKKYAVNAVKCSLRMHEIWGEKLSIGAHYGPFYLGRVGNEKSAFATVLGPTINSTCRLCYLCDEIGCKLCLSSILVGIASHLENMSFSFVGQASLAGVEDNMGVYTVKKIGERKLLV